MNKKSAWQDKFLAVTSSLRLSEYSKRRLYHFMVRRVAPNLTDSLDVLRKSKLFLVTSTGRTGTQWLSGMLNDIPNAYVVHEPVPIEQYDHARAWENPELAMSYLEDFRIRETAMRMAQASPEIYGEVNGALRRHLSELKQMLPSLVVVHLVRNGIDVTTSILNRQTFTARDGVYGKLVPREGMNKEIWNSMDRFSKIAWMWASDNAYIERFSDSRARFEDITTSYQSFREQILNPLGLEMDQSLWDKHAARPRNKSKTSDYKPDSWTEPQKAAFAGICGEQMHRYGYSS